MTAQQLIKSQAFCAMALAEAMRMISKDTGISMESLIEQFPKNKKLQERTAEMVAEAAKVTAEALKKELAK